MRARRAAVLLVAVTGLVLAPAAMASAAPTAGGCKAFGANVASLAQNPDVDFGATASSVARLFPRAFPTLVVHPEQAALCS